MIRVAHLVEDLDLGGIERFIQYVALFLDPAEFEVHVLCLSRGGVIAEELIEQGRAVRILGLRDYRSPGAVRFLASRLKALAPDLVHTHGYGAGLLGRISSIPAGVPGRIHHVHSTYHDMKRRHHFTERLLSLITCRVLCCSEAVKGHVAARQGIGGEKLTVLYNGVPDVPVPGIEEKERLKASLGIPPHAPILGTLGSLTENKGQRILLEALKELKECRALLVGDGPMAEDLKRTARELGISERVVFTGPQGDPGPFLHLMDLYVQPSREREGLSLSLLEAMASGKPVVASRVGGTPEVVDHGKTGLLVRPGDSAELARAVRSLLHSPGTLRKMGAKGRSRYIERFTVERMLEKIRETYRRCV